MKEQEIVNRALENLVENIEIKYNWNNKAPKGLDGEIKFNVNKTQHKLYVEVKKELRIHQLQQITELAKKYKNNFILIAEKIFPKIKEELRLKEIPYLEANGNIWFKQGHTYLWIDTNKEIAIEKEKTNRAFTKTGLKVIFHFLLKDDNINQTYRELAKNTGVALGNINNIIYGLKEYGYIVKLDETKYKLTNKKELIERWMVAYEERLKPTLMIGRFRFLPQIEFANWKKIKFKDNNTVWGAEPAGDIYTNFLKPATLTIYTNETKMELVKNYKLIPDPNGNIKVYKKFWNESNLINATPLLLTYADLMNTGDPRNIEIATKLVENEL